MKQVKVNPKRLKTLKFLSTTSWKDGNDTYAPRNVSCSSTERILGLMEDERESDSPSVTSDSATWGSLPTRLLCPWDSPGKNTGVGSPVLLQGILRAQGSNPGLLHWQADSLPSEPLERIDPFSSPRIVSKVKSVNLDFSEFPFQVDLPLRWSSRILSCHPSGNWNLIRWSDQFKV